MTKPILHGLVPNHDPRVYLLRIYKDDVCRYPIVAWRIEYYRHASRDRTDLEDEFTHVYPVTIDECPSNAIDCVVLLDGRVDLAEDRTFDNEAEALATLQDELRARA